MLCICVPCELFVSCFVHGDSYVDIGCKKLNNLVVHTTVLFQSALNSDTEVNREKKSSLNHKIKVTVVFSSEKH